MDDRAEVQDGGSVGADPKLNLTVNDTVGPDGLHAICDITHDGMTYTLGHDGMRVFKGEEQLPTSDDSGGPTFADGILTFTTELGGVFTVHMTGANAGQYTYTAPTPSLRHLTIEDGIPFDDPQQGTSRSTEQLLELFNEVTLEAFLETLDLGTMEVTRERLGDSDNNSTDVFSKKDVSRPSGDTDPDYSYSGLAIAGGNDGREIDVQNDGTSVETEIMRISFPGLQNSVYIGLGALYDGIVSDNNPDPDFDFGFLEQVRWVAYRGEKEVGRGTVDGTNDGLANFEIDSIVGGFDAVELIPLDNGAGDSAETLISCCSMFMASISTSLKKHSTIRSLTAIGTSPTQRR